MTAIQCDTCGHIAFAASAETMLDRPCSRPACSGRWQRAPEHDALPPADRRAVRRSR
jgi:hypothetical protein